MQISRLALSAAAAVILGSSGALAQQGNGASDIPQGLADEIRDGFIFVFHDDLREDVGRRASALTRQFGGRLGHVYSTAIKGFSANMPAQAAERMAAANPQIAYFEPDAVVRAIGRGGPVSGQAKPPWAGGGGGDDTPEPQTTPYGVTRVGGPLDGTSVAGVAWVIDTGIDLDHSDLNVDVARSANFIPRGKNSANDGNGHGTHVAGTIAAIDNEIDVVGVAAGATVIAVRVLGNSGSGSLSGVIAGVDYVAANGSPGDVANMSLGAADPGVTFTALDNAVSAAAASGIRFAIAAGNSSDDANDYTPARANGSNIYTVSAIDSNDNFAGFSNFGNPPVDFAAPGVNVLSTRNGGGVTTLSGTSMASPHVAGLLLFGAPNADGIANFDPDGVPDPIAHD